MRNRIDNFRIYSLTSLVLKKYVKKSLFLRSNLVFSVIARNSTMRKVLLALFLITTALAADDDPLFLYKKGLEAYEAQRFSEAKKLFESFVVTKPYEYEVRDAFFNIAAIQRRNKKYLDAISTYNLIQKRYPTSRYRKINLFYLGESYFKILIRHRAFYYLNEYLKKDRLPNRNLDLKIRTHNYLATIAKSKHRWKETIEHHQKSILLLSKYKKKNNFLSLKHVYHDMGLIYARHLKNQKLAYANIQKYIQLGGKVDSRLKFILRKIQFLRLNKNKLPDQNIADIKVDGDDIYIATWGAGLVRYTRSSDKYERLGLPSSQLRNIFVTFDLLFITSFDGIFMFDKKSDLSRRLIDGEVFSLVQKVIKDDRYLYFSTLTEGVIKYDLFRKTHETLGSNSYLKTNQVYSMAANTKYLAFGTLTKGVVLLNKQTNKKIYINKENNLLNGNNVKALLIDGRYLWIGIHKHGVYRYDMEQNKIKKYKIEAAYPTVIARREHEIWVGTSGHGIFIFDRKTEKVKNLRAIEGLSSNDISHIQVEGDYVWIGYLEAGIDIFYEPLRTAN